MAKDYGSSVGRSVGRAIGKAAVGAVFRPQRRKHAHSNPARSQADGWSSSWAFVIILGIFGLAKLLLAILIVLLVLAIAFWIFVQALLVVMRIGAWLLPIAKLKLPWIARGLVRSLRYLADRYW
jgi:uncharacterized membrane protein